MTELENYRQDLLELWHRKAITGELQGYPFAVVRSELGHLCGYVGLSDKTFKKFDAEMDVNCHGGITYDYSGEQYFGLTGHFIGFDCAHAGDWTPFFTEGTYKNIDFVLGEIRKIIKQLKGFEYGSK
ncbi:hypothetical protein [Streptococcus merionis]|uniref:hypothetical protein n=1 Tax=Streptococcus merionis TaxID=400065 RepID=UPI0035192E6D